MVEMCTLLGTTVGLHMCACLEWLCVCSDFVFVCFVHLCLLCMGCLVCEVNFP